MVDFLHNLSIGFSIAYSLNNLFYCFVGVLIGTLIGVLPGIGPAGTIAMLLPVSFKMDAVSSIIMMAGVYYGAQYGGSTTSILLNIPGEAASVVTCLDGYQMARKGRAGPALGMSAFSSFIGGTISVAGLMLLAPLLVQVALQFGPPEYFALTVFGLTMIAYLASGSLIKSLLMGALGLFLSTIGMDPISGIRRFTFGSITLSDGVGLIPVAMGMYGLAEVLENLEEEMRREVFKTDLRNLLPTLKDWVACRWAIVRGTIIGFLFGMLPGGSTALPTFIVYGLEKRASKYPEKFGTGVIEGVAAPETANNAATGSAMIPLLCLGIPANVAMAVLLGAFIIHGIQPGPLLMGKHPQLFWGTIASMYIGNVMLLILNLPLIGLWVQFLRVPYRLLFPLIVLFCFLGTYGVNNNFYDVLVMVIFGAVGYIMNKYRYQGAPLLLALILGPIMEMNFRQALIIGNPMIFFRKPISASLLGFAILLLTLKPLLKTVRRGIMLLKTSQRND
jgi:putative tricarboxylic transport membrane protein